MFTKIFRRDPRADICNIAVQADAADYFISENETHLANLLYRIQTQMNYRTIEKYAMFAF